MSKNERKFKQFKKRETVNIPSVMKPMPGSSYNPTQKAYKEVINKVVQEELKDIESEQKVIKSLQPHLFKEEEDLEVEGTESEFQEDSEEEQEDEGSDISSDDRAGALNAPVDRTDVKAKRIRNRELRQKEEIRERDRKREEKMKDKEFEKMEVYMNRSKYEAKQIEKKVAN